MGDSEARNVAEKALNRAYLKIWMKHSWADHQMPDPYELTLVVNQRSYPLPAYFGRIPKQPNGQVRPVRNSSSGREGRILDPVTEDMLERRFLYAGTSQETAGEPTHYTIGGTAPVDTQPSTSGDALEVLSDNASDDVRVAIAGLNSDGVYDRHQVTLTGTTAVALGTWKKVLELGKSFPAGTDAATEYQTSRGNVTVRKVTGATQIAKLLPEESAVERVEFTVYPKPDAANVLLIPVMRRPKRLLNDADMTPAMWGPALFEEMVHMWRENTGAVKSSDQLPKPALLDLLAWDQSNRFDLPRRSKGFHEFL